VKQEQIKGTVKSLNIRWVHIFGGFSEQT